MAGIYLTAPYSNVSYLTLKEAVFYKIERALSATTNPPEKRGGRQKTHNEIQLLAPHHKITGSETISILQ